MLKFQATSDSNKKTAAKTAQVPSNITIGNPQLPNNLHSTGKTIETQEESSASLSWESHAPVPNKINEKLLLEEGMDNTMGLLNNLMSNVTSFDSAAQENPNDYLEADGATNDVEESGFVKIDSSQKIITLEEEAKKHIKSQPGSMGSLFALMTGSFFNGESPSKHQDEKNNEETTNSEAVRTSDYECNNCDEYLVASNEGSDEEYVSPRSCSESCNDENLVYLTPTGTLERSGDKGQGDFAYSVNSGDLFDKLLNNGDGGDGKQVSEEAVTDSDLIGDCTLASPTSAESPVADGNTTICNDDAVTESYSGIIITNGVEPDLNICEIVEEEDPCEAFESALLKSPVASPSHTFLEDSSKFVDASTNTSIYDLNILRYGKIPDGYKWLSTNDRCITTGIKVIDNDKIPLKSMLDKGCTALEEDIDLASKKESEVISEVKSILERLHDMFPNFPADFIKEVVDKCNEDFNWAVDILVNSVPEDGMILDEEKIRERRAQRAAQEANGTPEKSSCGKGKPSSSSDSNDSNSEASTHSIRNGTKKKKKFVQDEKSLQLQREFEEKLKINDASYNPHILRVKRWKQGEITSPDKFEELPATTSDVIEFTPEYNAIREAEEQQSISEDFMDFSHSLTSDIPEAEDISSETSNSDEIMELSLGCELIKSLENEFGNLECQFTDSLLPVVHVKKSMAQQLYALWIESVQQQLRSQQEQFDEMISKGAEYNLS